MKKNFFAAAAALAAIAASSAVFAVQADQNAAPAPQAGSSTTAQCPMMGKHMGMHGDSMMKQHQGMQMQDCPMMGSSMQHGSHHADAPHRGNHA